MVTLIPCSHVSSSFWGNPSTKDRVQCCAHTTSLSQPHVALVVIKRLMVQARLLLQDLQTLALAFVASLAARLKAAFAASDGSEVLQEAADGLRVALLKHHSSSIAHVQVRRPPPLRN